MQQEDKKTENVQNTRDSVRPALLQIYTQPAFLICAALLALASIAMPYAIEISGTYLEKKPLPLKKSLDALDANGLAYYKVVTRKMIENKEMLKTLGTEHYIQWTLEDSQAVATSTVRNCQLFITYYEVPDVVPHVPEECYSGGGYQRLKSEGVTLKVSNLKSGQNEIQVKHLVFSRKSDDFLHSNNEFGVLYVINVNGIYAGNRDDARLALNKNLFGKQSYFCKIEWKFFNPRLGSTGYPTKEETTAASQKLLNVILPILEKEHWPDSSKSPDGVIDLKKK